MAPPSSQLSAENRFSTARSARPQMLTTRSPGAMLSAQENRFFNPTTGWSTTDATPNQGDAGQCGGGGPRACGLFQRRRPFGSRGRWWRRRSAGRRGELPLGLGPGPGELGAPDGCARGQRRAEARGQADLQGGVQPERQQQPVAARGDREHAGRGHQARLSAHRDRRQQRPVQADPGHQGPDRAEAGRAVHRADHRAAGQRGDRGRRRRASRSSCSTATSTRRRPSRARPSSR